MLPRVRSLAPLALALVAALPAATAAQPEWYHLFHPVPDSAMREMSTDRPDRTESAYTLDAGHFQLEMDVLVHTRDATAGARLDALRVAAPNLKAGLTTRVDLQLVLESWNRERVSLGVLPEEERSGFGDTSLRLKVNAWGNDGGPTALAAMPFVTFPTSQNGLGVEELEGGLIVPLAVALPGDWGLGLMAQLNIHRYSGGTHPEWVVSATTSHDLLGELAGFVELFGARSTDAGTEWTSTLDAGLTYAVHPRLTLDAGFYAGLTEVTEDLVLFLGLSLRR